MSLRTIVRSLTLLVIAVLIARGSSAAQEQAKSPQHHTLSAQQGAHGFSFAVYGDSRSMMYLPYKQERGGAGSQAHG